MAAGSLWVTQECEFLPSRPWALSHGMCAFKLFLTCWPEQPLKLQFAVTLGSHIQPGCVPWSSVGFREESAQHLIVWGVWGFFLLLCTSHLLLWAEGLGGMEEPIVVTGAVTLTSPAH